MEQTTDSVCAAQQATLHLEWPVKAQINFMNSNQSLATHEDRPELLYINLSGPFTCIYWLKGNLPTTPLTASLMDSQYTN